MPSAARPCLVIGKIMYEKTRRFSEAEAHELHELVYVVEGRYRAHVEAADLHGSSGDVFYYPPGLWHSSEIDHATIYLLQWHEPIDPQVDRRQRRSRDPTGRLLTILKWIGDLAHTRDPIARRIEADLLDAVAQQLSLGPAEDEPDPVRRVREYMTYYLDRPLNLDALAEVAGVSRSTLIRHFRETVGTTPMAHLRRLRLEAARNLLQSSDLPLKSVAARVGLASASHLAHLIRRLEGRTARELG